MNTSIRLFADPFEGARAAHRVLHRDATDQDWENFVAASLVRPDGKSDDYSALANLCQTALQIDRGSGADRDLILYASGLFRQSASIVRAMDDSLPASPFMPHHLDRYRNQLRQFPTRFSDR